MIIDSEASCSSKSRGAHGMFALPFAALALVAMLPSCSMMHEHPDGSSMLTGDPESSDIEEYRALEHLEGNPLDLMTAEPGELRSLPGFPERLVERILEERERNGTGRRLFEALTPPEQMALRRYEPYLELPGRLPVRLEAWCTTDRLGPGRERRDDARLALKVGGFRLSARYRSDAVYRFYIAGSAPSGHARFHGGDFTPDLAMGLCFSSYASTYPFSHGYHIRRRRWVSGTTSLYGASMRGGAAEFWAGSIHALFLGGRLCRYSGGRLDAYGPALLSGRIAFSRGVFSAGAGLYCMNEEGGAPISSVDASWSEGRLEASAELATGGGRWSGLWAISVRGEGSHMSLLLYELAEGMDHPLGRPFYGSGGWRRGGSILLHRRVTRHLRLCSAWERSDAGDHPASKRRDLVRLELRWSSGGNSVKLSLKRRIEDRSLLVPYPTAGEQAVTRMADSIHLLQSWRLPGSLRLRLSCRAPLEKGVSGYLVCPSLTVDRNVSMTASWALHRALEGAPLFYCYERSLKGLYPWRALRGSGWRVALIGRVSVGSMRFAFSLAATHSGSYEGATHVGTTF